MALFESVDLRDVFERERRVVQPLGEAKLARRIDLEAMLAAVGTAKRLRFEVNVHLGAGTPVQLLPQGNDILRRKHHGQQAVTKTVAEENLAEARRDDAAK